MSETTKVEPLSDEYLANLRKEALSGAQLRWHGRWPGDVLRLLDALDTAHADRARLEARVEELEAELTLWRTGIDPTRLPSWRGSDDPAAARDAGET